MKKVPHCGRDLKKGRIKIKQRRYEIKTEELMEQIHEKLQSGRCKNTIDNKFELEKDI